MPPRLLLLRPPLPLLLLLLLLLPPPSSPTPCSDHHAECAEWTALGLCTRNPHAMLEACPLSCDVCSEAAALAAVRSRLLSRAGCTDRHEACAAWAARGDCARLDAVRAACAASCGSCGEASRAACDDIDAQCAGWAEVGECARNPEAMGRSCARSCGLCEGGGGEEEGKEGGEGAAAAVAAVLCLDSRPDCPGWALSGECGRNPAVPRACPKSCGRCAPHRTPTTREKSAPTASDSLPADSLPADGEASPSSRGEALLPLPARTPCKDEAEPDVCRSWAEAGECTRNLRSMHAACRKTCDLCVHPLPPEAAPSPCRDLQPDCVGWAQLGECERNLLAMRANCPRSCGSCPPREDREVAAAAAAAAARGCIDRHAACAERAAAGLCWQDPAGMRRECARSCQLCHPDAEVEERMKEARDEARAARRESASDRRARQTHAAEDGHWSLESWSRLSVVTNLVLTCALLYVCVRKLGCRPCRRRRAAPPLASPPRRRAPSKGSARSAKGSPRGGGSGDEKATAASASTTMRYVVPLASLRGMPQADQLIGMIEPTEAHSAHSSREIDVPAACAATNQSDTAYRDSYIIKVGS